MNTTDKREIQAGLSHLIRHTAVVEMRVLDAPRAEIVSAYFDDTHRDGLAQACSEWSGRAAGVYITLNPVRADLLARARNRVRTWAKQTTADQDVLHRVCLPVDFDPKRPSGISATDGEHQAALARAQDCHRFLQQLGWPDPVYGDSGNGANLVFRVELNNDPAAAILLSRCLQVLALHFDDDAVTVDQTTFNAARIWRVPGTLNCKGDSLAERPHRLAKLLDVPATLEVVSLEQLQRLAAMLGEPKSAQRPARRSAQSFDLPRWIDQHKLPVVATKSWHGGTLWLINPCPWNAVHTNRAAYVIQFANGAISAGCHHNGCAGKGWPELRDLYEPWWRERRRQPKLLLSKLLLSRVAVAEVPL